MLCPTRTPAEKGPRQSRSKRFKLRSFPARIPVLSQPRGQLRLLLRLQIDTVVDALNRLPISPFCRSDLVSVKELRYLIAHSGITETAGGSDYLSARKWPPCLLDLGPVTPGQRGLCPRWFAPQPVRQDHEHPGPAPSTHAIAKSFVRRFRLAWAPNPLPS